MVDLMGKKERQGFMNHDFEIYLFSWKRGEMLQIFNDIGSLTIKEL